MCRRHRLLRWQARARCRSRIGPRRCGSRPSARETRGFAHHSTAHGERQAGDLMPAIRTAPARPHGEGARDAVTWWPHRAPRARSRGETRRHRRVPRASPGARRHRDLRAPDRVGPQHCGKDIDIDGGAEHRSAHQGAGGRTGLGATLQDGGLDRLRGRSALIARGQLRRERARCRHCVRAAVRRALPRRSAEPPRPTMAAVQDASREEVSRPHRCVG